MLDGYWQDIFDEELSGWAMDEADRPQDRTLDLFMAWFDVELGQGVTDLAPDEPLTEDDVNADDFDVALSTCSWCGTELDDNEGRVVGFMLRHREELAHREGRRRPRIQGLQP